MTEREKERCPTCEGEGHVNGLRGFGLSFVVGHGPTPLEPRYVGGVPCPACHGTGRKESGDE